MANAILWFGISVVAWFSIGLLVDLKGRKIERPTYWIEMSPVEYLLFITVVVAVLCALKPYLQAQEYTSWLIALYN